MKLTNILPTGSGEWEARSTWSIREGNVHHCGEHIPPTGMPAVKCTQLAKNATHIADKVNEAGRIVILGASARFQCRSSCWSKGAFEGRLLYFYEHWKHHPLTYMNHHQWYLGCKGTLYFGRLESWTLFINYLLVSTLLHSGNPMILHIQTSLSVEEMISGMSLQKGDMILFEVQ